MQILHVLITGRYGRVGQIRIVSMPAAGPPGCYERIRLQVREIITLRITWLERGPFVLAAVESKLEVPDYGGSDILTRVIDGEMLAVLVYHCSKTAMT